MLAKSMVAALSMAVTLLPASVFAETQLRLATQMPPSHHSVKLLETFAKDVSDATGGSVQVQIHPSGQLLKGPELPTAVGSGSIEMGDMVTPYIAPIYPELELLDGPFMIDSVELAKELFAGALKQPLTDKFERLGMKIVAIHPYGFFSMYGTKGHVIEKPEDMKGLSIRAVDKIQILKAQAVGAKPVAIPGSEQFIAYQKGTVDVGQTGPSSFVSRKLYEVFDTGAILRDDLMVFFLAINANTWSKLSSEEQDAITKAGDALSAASWDLMMEEEVKADKFLPDHMKVTIIDGEQEAAWRDAFAEVNEKLAKDAGDAGKELLDIVQSARAKLAQ